MFVTYAVRICRGLKINFDWRHGTLEYVHIRCAGVSCGANGHIYIYIYITLRLSSVTVISGSMGSGMD